MFEAAVFAHAFRQHFFARMPERGMPEIVGEGDSFRQVFIQAQCSCDGTTDRCDFDGVGQSGAQMVARPVEENLCLVFQPAKSARMNDARAIALELGAIGVTRLGKLPAARFA